MMRTGMATFQIKARRAPDAEGAAMRASYADGLRILMLATSKLQRLPAQRILDPARHREHIRVALREAQHLQPERQAAIVQHRQADARGPQHGAGHDEDRVACGLQADRRGPGAVTLITASTCPASAA